MGKLWLALLVIVLSGCNMQRGNGPVTNRAVEPPPASPTPEPFVSYTAPKIKEEKVYVVALLGDSMTAALGPHGGLFTQKLNEMYQSHDILVDNYGVGSTNLTSLNERLDSETQVNEWTYEPLVNREDVDLVIVESFAYNPLSQISDRSAALAEQERLLTELMTRLTSEMPNARIVFLSTIAPNKLRYGSSVTGASSEASRLQAEERIEYLQNHIKFAREHDIPVVDVTGESMIGGSGAEIYVNSDDWIHPSGPGIDLISTKMAEFVYENRILPD